MPPPSAPTDETGLDDALSRPSDAVVAALARLDGDILVLGAGGKLGLSVATMAARALAASGSRHRVVAVSRFREPPSGFEAAGISTISRDLLEDGALEALPDARNVLLLAGMKFGSSGAQSTTWAMNTYLPALVARRFRGSRIVALSTGNVYAFTGSESGGSGEEDPPAPLGEYAITCLGRERMLEWSSERDGTPVAIIRLNYANALRYGVLVDIGTRVMDGRPIDVTMGFVNVIWQGDANSAILRAFGHTASPPFVLNVAGPETLSVRWIARRFAELLDVPEPAFTGAEAPTALLSDSTRMVGLFGPPSIPADTLLEWTAGWLKGAGRLLGKPTSFEVRDGRF